jgi:putative DNA primase/helicase
MIIGSGREKMEDVDEIKMLVMAGRKQDARLMTAHYLMNKHNFITTEDNDVLMVYKDGVYHNSATPTISQEVHNIWVNNTTRNDIREITEAHLKPLTYINRGELNPGDRLLPLKNGVLDVRNRILQPHSPETKFTFQLPVSYNMSCTPAPVKEYVEGLVGADQARVVQEMMGYLLIRSYPYSKAFMLKGGGKNGKSMFLRFLEAFLGEENITAPSLQELLYNRFSKSELYGKMACLHDDLPNSALKSTGNFKMITGGATIHADIKFQKPFKFKNYAKLIYTTNHLPKTEDTSDAFWRRWIIIDFFKTFTETDEDPHILDKTTTPEFLSAALNWALDGLDRVFMQNKFSTSETIQDTKARWIMETDPLRGFVEKFVEYSPAHHITKDEFHHRLNDWCEDNDFATYTKQYVGQNLPTILTKVRGNERLGSKKIRIWKGVKWLCDDYNDNKTEYTGNPGILDY